jgi:hypothetical protein
MNAAEMMSTEMVVSTVSGGEGLRLGDLDAH